MQSCKAWLLKHKDMLPYLFFGVCTTLVNIIVYWLTAHLLKAGVVVSTIVAWLAAVLFAYFTNRKWVFHSEAHTAFEIVRELISFFGCRLLTGALDVLLMYIFADWLSYPDVPVKIATNVVIVICNYAASKLLIFRKKS